MNKIFKWAIVLTVLSINSQSLYAHKDHKDKPAMPAIGIVQGEILDSTSMKPIEYASVSLVDLEHNELITGGLSDKSGRVNITEVPLGKYVAVIEFMGYAKKEIGPLNIYPGEGGGIRQNIGTIKMSISSLNMAAVDVIGDESTFIQTIDKKIFNVGSICNGRYTPMSVSDYTVGTNHVLPTSGSSKFSSGLNINEFIKKISVVTLSKLGVEKIGNPAITLSEFEQLYGHAQSIKSRMRRN